MEQFWYYLGRLLGAFHDLRDHSFRFGSGRRHGRRYRLLVLWMTIAYAVSLVIALASVSTLAGRHWFFSAAAFLPPLGWLLPLGILFPLAVWKHPWMVIVQLVCAGMVLIPFMGLTVSREATVGKPESLYVTAAANNVASNLGSSPAAFLQGERPAILLFQEVFNLEPELAAFLQEYPYQVRAGEFLTASRFPLREMELIADHREGPPIAMRCVASCWSTDVVVYNVHLPTRQGTLIQLKGRGIFLSDVHRQLREDLLDRQQRTTYLQERLGAETCPLLVGGDFNLPSHSAIYDQYTSVMQDAFVRRGTGYGFTIPGVSHNPVGLWGPWLRIDYLFSSNGLRPTGFRTEPKRRTQHLAIAATFELSDE